MQRNETPIFGLVVIAVFSLIWVNLVIPEFASSLEFASLNPVVQYFAYNLGYVAVTSIVFGLPFAFAGKRAFRRVIIDMLEVGLVSFLVFSLFFDMNQPPMWLNDQGVIVGSLNPQSLPYVSVDAVTSYFWGLFGITGPTLYQITYSWTPIMALVLGTLIYGVKLFYLVANVNTCKTPK